MTSNWHMGNSVCDSQNFNLRLSGSSSGDSSLQRFVTNKKTEDENDIIVISDSSCSLSPEHTDKSRWKSSSTSKVKNKEYQKLHFLEISSSESERESDSSWKIIRPDNKFSKKKYVDRTIKQVDKSTEASLISNDISLTSDRLFDNLTSKDALNSDKTAMDNNVNDRNQINKSKRFIDKSKRYINDGSPTLITKQEINSKLKEKYNTEETNKIIKPNYVYNDSPNVLSRHPIYNTPKQNSTGKTGLTKKDTHKILKNIKCTQIVYDSSRKKKENNVIIDESTDIDEDIIHPAISPSYNKKVQHPNNSPDVIDSSRLSKNNILQTDLSEPSKPHIDISRVMNSFRPLSERRKKQIREWLLTNFSDSQNDSSINTVPPSTRNSNSGNSSLERLEQTYETPNNRGRINKAQIDEKQRTIVNSDRMIDSFLTRQVTMDEYFKKSKINSEFCTPDNKPRFLPKAQTDKKASSVVNTFETKDYADILDKLYGTSWRNKAHALFPTTEPRKTSNQPTNRIQTEW